MFHADNRNSGPWTAHLEYHPQLIFGVLVPCMMQIFAENWDIRDRNLSIVIFGVPFSANSGEYELQFPSSSVHQRFAGA